MTGRIPDVERPDVERPDGEGSDGGTAAARRSAERRAAVLLTLAGAGLIILACTRTWATVRLGGELVPGLSELTVSGRRLAPAALPVALAAAAGAIVLATSGRVVRAVVAAGLAIAGVLLALTMIANSQDEAKAINAALRDALGLMISGSGQGGIFYGGLTGSDAVTVSIWPWVATAGSGLLFLAGLLALIRGWSWPGPSRRYEPAGRPVSPVVGRAGVPSEDMRPKPGPSGSTGAASWGSPPEPGPAGTWDALSRGEDPTSAPDDHT
jgi:uncharacterized membrane protein (TIGR02234 family)